MKEHTPLPWEVCCDDCHQVIWPETASKIACVMFGETINEDEAQANAKFIVKACNMHEELIEVAKAVIEYDKAIESCKNDANKMNTYCTAQGDSLDSLYFRWRNLAKQAIAKTEKTLDK